MDDWLTDVPPRETNLPSPKPDGPQIRVMQRKTEPAESNQRVSPESLATAEQAAARYRQKQAEYQEARQRIFGETKRKRGMNNSRGRGNQQQQDARNQQYNRHQETRQAPGPIKATFTKKNDADDPDYDRSRYVLKSTTAPLQQDAIR